ncbi:MAG: conjugal transfer protein TraL [Clostridiales bacterium]|nr:conjugal transfer protein TraL [Clostridiales bacterium]
MQQHKFITLCSLPIFAVLALSLSLTLDAAGIGTALTIALCLTLFTGLAFFALFRSKAEFDAKIFLPALIAAYLLLLLRVLCFDKQTGDYVSFLKPWTQYFRDNGGFAGLGRSIGNYNIPYLTFLALFSYIPVSELYLIKLLSVGFDLLLAVSVAKLVLRCTGSPVRYMIAFAVTLLLPTVLLNGAYWGQCDSIYAGLAALSLYFILSGRPWLSMAALALSFSFKLQAIFIFPVFLVFLFTGKLKLYHLPLFPAVYFAAVSPAILAGRPVLDTLLLYVNQGSTVGNALNYNSPSVYSLFYHVADPAGASATGIICAFAFCAAMFILLFLLRGRLGDAALLLSAFIFVLAVPLFLPHMHERYFFMADVLALAVAFVFPKAAFFPALCAFASLLGYHAYLQGRFFLPMRWGFWALAIVLLLSLMLLFSDGLAPKNQKSTVQAPENLI